MHPEASVSGLYFNHPEARYFGISTSHTADTAYHAPAATVGLAALRQPLAFPCQRWLPPL